LDSALTVSDIMNFLTCDLIDIGKDSRKIIVSHVLKGELPKLFSFVWVVFSMISGVFVTSAIAQPHIVALIGKHKSWSFILVIEEPRIRTVKKAMLKQDWLEAISDDCIFLLDSEESQDVAVFSGNMMGLNRIVEEFAIVSELQFRLRVSAGGQNGKCQQQKYSDDHTIKV